MTEIDTNCKCLRREKASRTAGNSVIIGTLIFYNLFIRNHSLILESHVIFRGDCKSIIVKEKVLLVEKVLISLLTTARGKLRCTLVDLSAHATRLVSTN
jgi:hypothetical protein